MSFVTASDFNLIPYNIPNLTGNNSFSPFVVREEADVLKKLLGLLLYNAFIEGLAALPNVWATGSYDTGDEVTYGNNVYTSAIDGNASTPGANSDWTLTEEDNRWLMLKNGTTYTYNSKSYEWKGMVAMLTPYIYGRWTTDYTVDTHTENAIITVGNENGTPVSAADRIVEAFAEFSEIAGSCYNYGGNLYGFIYTSEDLYLDAVESEFATISSYLYENFSNPVDGVNDFDL